MGRRWAAAWLLGGLLGAAAPARAEPAPRAPLDGLAFRVAITHGGRWVGQTLVRFERGWLVTSGRRWRDRARYRWRQKDDVYYFSATATAVGTHEYDGSVRGESIKAIFSAKQGSETLSYDFSGRREARFAVASGKPAAARARAGKGP